MKKVVFFSRYSAAKIAATQSIQSQNNNDIPHKEQIKILNIAYINDAGNDNKICKNIKKKIQGYKAQDKRWEGRGAEGIIHLEEVLEKLVVSKLRCDYCSGEIKLLYNASRDPKQWTLDRIDNDLGHTSDNTIVACMSCNLQRRRRSADAFIFTKKLTLHKVE